MAPFFLAFLVTLVLTVAGREGVRVARLAAALGPGVGLIGPLAISLIATSALAAWAGAMLAPTLPLPARQMFVALALGLAAVELLVLRAPRTPAEPTRSSGAILIVLLASQLTDHTRLAIAALALATGEPVLAALGGMAGSGAALALAVVAGPAWEQRVPVCALAVSLAIALLLAAAVIALGVRGLLG